MRDDKIVPFSKKRHEAEAPRETWTCRCGSQQHYVYSDGSLECYVCGNVTQNGTWSKDNAARLIEDQHEARLVDSSDHATADLARASVLKKAKERSDVAFVFVGYDTGGVSVWRGLEATPPTDEQRAWFRRRVEDCLALSFDEPLPQEEE